MNLNNCIFSFECHLLGVLHEFVHFSTVSETVRHYFLKNVCTQLSKISQYVSGICSLQHGLINFTHFVGFF
jgi:hypothetical protein